MKYYPLLFTPVYKDYLWGGQRIGRHFYRAGLLPTVCAESWEVAARPEGMSVVKNGDLSGHTLAELLVRHGTEILGAGHPAGPFPLLIKVLDARERLSVQVHPNDVMAARHGGEAKTEMWYVLDALPAARVYAGLKAGTTPDALRAALVNQLVEPLLNAIPVTAGDAIFMPGGRVHAIGEGCLILEVQQNSNTTYRLFDWGRLDQQGRARELHIEQAIPVIDWDNPSNPKLAPALEVQTPAGTFERIHSCPYFSMHRLRIQARMLVPRPPQTCVILFVASGAAIVTAGGVDVPLTVGTSCLVPAACETVQIDTSGGKAEILVITPGEYHAPQG